MTSPMESPDRAKGSRPPEQPAGVDGEPRFGRLLVVLACAVAIVIAIVFASAAWFGI